VVGMALLPERSCSVRPRSRAVVGAVVLKVIPEGFGPGHPYDRLDRTARPLA